MRHNRTVLQIGTIIVLAVSLWLIHLGREAFWEDELFSVFYPRAGLGFMWTNGLFWETNPPLYYTLVWIWQRLVGSSEFLLRLPSLLLLAATIPIVYLLGRELLSRNHGLLGAALFALSPTSLYYAHFARGYALYTLAASVVLLGLARVLCRTASAANLSIYVGGGTLCIYTHTSSVLLLAACNLVVIARLGVGGRWREVRSWLTANIALAIIGAPEAMAMLTQMTAGYQAWSYSFTYYLVAAIPVELVAGPATPLRFPGLLLTLLVCVAIALSLWRRRLPGVAWLVLIGVPVVFFVSGLLISVIIKQWAILPRAFSWASVSLSLLASHAILIPRVRMVSTAVIGVTFTVGLWLELTKPANSIEPWRVMLPQIETDLAKSKAIILLPHSSPGAIVLYAPGLQRNLKVIRNLGPGLAETIVVPQLLGVPLVSIDDTLELITAGDAWIVGHYDYSEELKQILPRAPEPNRRVEHVCRNGHVCFLALHWE